MTQASRISGDTEGQGHGAHPPGAYSGAWELKPVSLTIRVQVPKEFAEEKGVQRQRIRGLCDPGRLPG